MNTFNSDYDIESLLSSLEQLQIENKMWKEKTLILQRSLDELKRDFLNREEKKQIQSMQETISQLSAKISELQQCLSQLSVVDNGFIYPSNNEIVNQEQDFNDDELVNNLLDLMDE